MAAIGVGLVWWSYWWGLSGFSLIKGWNNNPWKMANPLKIATFTTRCYTGTAIFPSGEPGDSGSCGKSAGGFSPDVIVPKIGSPGHLHCPPGTVRQGSPNGGWVCVPRQFLLAPQPPGGGIT